MSLMRSTLIVAAASSLSRVLGFVRDVLLANALGAGPVADAFLAAFRVPNAVRRILSEGALNAGFIPIYAGLRSERGSDAAEQFAATVAARPDGAWRREGVHGEMGPITLPTRPAGRPRANMGP